MGTSEIAFPAKSDVVVSGPRERWRWIGRDIGHLNQRVFQRRGVLRQYASATGWLDAGEKAAVASVADQIAGHPILDIGIGGGRTAPLLRQISDDYHGIDYVPAMVAMARRKFPNCVFAVMDARHLDFPDAGFAFALFSYNGIDCVGPADRLAVLREVHRVLQPGGYFAFSTLNRDGAEWSVPWPDWRVYNGTGRHPLLLLRATTKLLVGGINRLHGLMAQRDWGDLAIGSLSAHNFALLTVFASLAEDLRQLQETGFAVAAVFDPEGRSMPLESASSGRARCFHIVVQKPRSAGGMPQGAPTTSVNDGE
jgi:ubiquinone/menaquinone biosynthesis C-methylase UbiE